MSGIDCLRTGKRFLAVLLIFGVLPPTSAQEQGEPGAPEPVAEPAPDGIRPSDSPYLRPPADLRNAEPIKPYKGPPGPPVADPMATITYTPATGLTILVPSSGAEELPTDELRSVEPFAGLAAPIATAAALLDQKSVIGFDDRTRVTSTGSFPWRSLVRLGVKWTSSGGVGACSGALISNYHVLTAGHCVFDYGGTDDWAYSIQVFPGLDDDEMPYNYAWATRYRSYVGWTNSGMTEHDWAVIALDRSVGTFTGWMGRLTANSGNSVYTGILNVAGYPGTPDGNATCPTWANCQYWDSDSGHSADAFNHWYWMDTSGGMSGSPVWRFLSSTDERHILTVHTCGTGGCGAGGNGVNHGTRLDTDKFDRIPAWISADSDIIPNNRADLIDDGQAFSGFSPISVSAGQAFSAWSDVRNVGTAASGSFHVSYYASVNTVISTGDFLIGNDLASSTNPFTWTSSDLSVSFPGGIPDGTYYVGWIIDRFGAVPEFDEGNNSAYKTSYQLSVCNKADTPSLLSPADGAQTTDQTPNFDWNDVGGADSYRLQVDDSSSFGSPVVNVVIGSSNFTPGSNLDFGTYYWRVRADKACGTLGDWSATRSFEVSPTPSSSCDVKQVSNSKIAVLATYGACRELRGGPSLTITGTAHVTLEAGTRVVLFDGFKVEPGGTLKIQTCGHGLCDTGTAFEETCHSCVAAICAADAFCCTASWDAACVAQVSTVCGLTCP